MFGYIKILQEKIIQDQTKLIFFVLSLYLYNNAIKYIKKIDGNVLPTALIKTTSFSKNSCSTF